MSGKKNGKPKSITPISIFFILTAILLLLHVLASFNFRPLFKIFEIMRSMGLSVPVFLVILFSLNKYSVIIFGLETALVLLALFSAIGLLSLKNWARIALIVVAAVEIFIFSGHLGFWAVTANLLPDVTTALLGARSFETLTVFLSIYTGAVLLFLIVPLVISIIILRSDRVKSAVS
jgi:hypothetical protein